MARPEDRIYPKAMTDEHWNELRAIIEMIHAGQYEFDGQELDAAGHNIPPLFNEKTLNFIDRAGIDQVEDLTELMANEDHFKYISPGKGLEARLAFIFKCGEYYLKAAKTIRTYGYMGHRQKIACVAVHDQES